MRTFGFVLFLSTAACANFRGPGPYRSAEYVGGGESIGTLPPPPVHSNDPKDDKPFAWPVAQVRINRGFAPMRTPRHLGLDLGGAAGTPILAAHGGRVIYAGHGFKGYGNMVMLERDGRWATLYAHLSRVRVSEGEDIHAGDLIGLMGQTGDATGVHLHFEVMRDKQPIDPLHILTPLVRGLATVPSAR